MSRKTLLDPCPFCGEKLFLDVDDEGGIAILHSLKEKDCFFPSILEIEFPAGTTFEQMIEKINRRPQEESFSHALVGASLLSDARLQDKDFEIRDLKDEIDRLEAEAEKHRWIAVEDMSKLDDGKCYQVLTKENPFFPDCEFYSFNDGWATDKEVTHYREIDLPEPPKEEE